MNLLIDDNRTLSDLQKDFSREFPFLKIEFFDSQHGPKEASPRTKIYRQTLKVADCRKVHTNGKFLFSKDDTVEKFEDGLWNLYGLSTQVFRKSGKLWIETSLTDSWTLDRQNAEGKEFSSNEAPIINTEENDPLDRDKWQ